MVLNAHVREGQVVLDNAIVLPEGAELRIEVLPQMPGPAAPTLFDDLQELIGSMDGLPVDSSTNLDHYLYGVPKRS